MCKEKSRGRFRDSTLELSAEDDRQMEALGWARPDPPLRHTWWLEQERPRWVAQTLAAMVVRTTRSQENAGVIVRPATAADAEALAVVQVRTWQDAYRGQVPQEHLDQLDPSRRHEPWRRWIGDARPPAATLVAEDEARGVVGFVSVSPSRDTARTPACRRG